MKYDKREEKSELLMLGVIDDLLTSKELGHFDRRMHVSLSDIIPKSDFHLLTEEELLFVGRSGSHVDFVIFNKMDKEPVVFIEVDGFSNHENNVVQTKRDILKNEIFRKCNLRLIRFATNGSSEKNKLRSDLNEFCMTNK
jgi:hypothetical protein